VSLCRTSSLCLAAVSAVALSGCSQSTSTSTSTSVATSPVPAPQAVTSAPAAERPLGVFAVTCHTGSGRTASGRTDGPGLAAVDPDVLPFGTRVRVDKVGVITAADSGSSLTGSSLDVWAPSEAACAAFGRQQLQVWRLGS
jgi:3D (Asp-Asp-Asp) domain-containing protein